MRGIRGIYSYSDTMGPRSNRYLLVFMPSPSINTETNTLESSALSQYIGYIELYLGDCTIS